MADEGTNLTMHVWMYGLTTVWRARAAAGLFRRDAWLVVVPGTKTRSATVIGELTRGYRRAQNLGRGRGLGGLQLLFEIILPNT